MSSTLDKSVFIERLGREVQERYAQALRLLDEASRQAQHIQECTKDEGLLVVETKINADIDRLKLHAKDLDRKIKRRAEITAARGFREQEELIREGVLIRDERGTVYYAPNICHDDREPAHHKPCIREACPKWAACFAQCPGHFPGPAAPAPADGMGAAEQIGSGSTALNVPVCSNNEGRR